MNGGNDDPSRPKMELESASFDGFCITWSPVGNGLPECPVSVRFNFLSTDFSHSKGVKGSAVRLCAKTELLSTTASPDSLLQPAHEVCYCKVKLFRDHGAERKLSNDVAHVKKTIEKLTQQLAQAEAGMRDISKRKRSGSIANKTSMSHGPGKVPKHRRTWSMSSNASASGKTAAEDDLQRKLVSMQDMFGSTRATSIFFLRGEEGDDPDLHPVHLTGQPHNLAQTEGIDTTMWEGKSAKAESSVVSPTPSNQSLGSAASRNHADSAFGLASRGNSNDWGKQSHISPMDLQSSNPQHLASPPDQPVKIQTRSPETGRLSGWIESLGVDPSYQPPPEKVLKPGMFSLQSALYPILLTIPVVACLYIQPRVSGRMPDDGFYRAIYLQKRTLKDFISAIATKCNIEPTRVLRTLRVSRNGLHVLMDDETVQELPEGQDMTAEFSEIQSVPKLREWDSGSTDLQVDGDSTGIQDQPCFDYELKLLY